MSDLSTRLALAKELPRHLSELGQLLGRPVDSAELLSLEETEYLRTRTKEIEYAPLSRWEVKFEEKETPRFQEFVTGLAELNPSDVYIWTPVSNICGLLPPVSLLEVDFCFPFSLNPEGILVILTSDLNDQLLLDYSIGADNERWLEIEVRGRAWGRASY